ncbi:hypothetical protein [Streptosporangium saharense]|uniref:MFS transporter n=1 Tax=Streptosporangium saharense TaxID=1706840 RepID=A0A7W7QU25_9ACTN|nr:hypothetical protein [Streptosporangium saharense]MBB4919780.1 hypothetical protein [Streptosporangium saharense]
MGALRDATGDFTLAFGALGVAGLLTLVPVARLRDTIRQPVRAG